MGIAVPDGDLRRAVEWESSLAGADWYGIRMQ
jgi:hypothetical protein